MSSLYKTFKKYHKWLGVSLAFFFILFGLSGIVLNHRGFFSSYDVSRSWLPKGYRYDNWNNAAVRGATPIGNDSLLIYGNIGIWLTNDSLSAFIDFNRGFPKGIDKRKVSDIHKTHKGDLFAATLFGLYRLSKSDRVWEKIELPIVEKRIVAIEEFGDSLLVISRSYVLVAYGDEDYQKFAAVYIDSPLGVEKRVSLFKTIWFIHSGEVWGITGKIIVDIGGVAMIFLSLTGIFYFIAPKLLRRVVRNRHLRKGIKRTNRWSYMWHLNVGIAVSLLLLIVTATGMFLRPPLLIPIASKTVKPIKGSQLDSPNFWNDKFRDLLYDHNRNIFLLATLDGIYLVPTDFSHPPFKSPLQPPVSIMGINVFWIEDEGHFAVGSFSGMYKWNPYRDELTDYFKSTSVDVMSGLRSPFGNTPIAGGLVMPNGGKVFFDYNSGAFSHSNQLEMPQMPQEIISKSGMSLWNLALEVHTWRILGFLINDFYILVVPLGGILGVIIVITGITMWLIRRSRSKERLNLSN